MGIRDVMRSSSCCFVVNHSGGKDSMRMLGRLREEYPDVETICVTADTGFEHRKPIPAAEWVKMRCASLANPVPVVVVRNAKKTYLEMVERRGNFLRQRSSGSALPT